jgi:hypothetical protein
MVGGWGIKPPTKPEKYVLKINNFHYRGKIFLTPPPKKKRKENSGSATGYL